jgi:hypothetical protein
MAKHKTLNVLFPIGGLNKRAAYRQQQPYTTPDANNVRPRATFEGRERGGSRPGLVLSHVEDIGTNVRLLVPIVLNLGDDFTSFSDSFTGSSLATAWSQGSWATDIPTVISNFASVDTTLADSAAVLSALSIDTSQVYEVGIFVVPYSGAHHGKYQLFIRMDDSSPDITDEGVQVELILTGSSGAYSGTLKSYVGGTPTSYDLASSSTGSADPGWLLASVSGDQVTVYWQGIQLIQQTVPTSHTGKRVGFGMETTVAGGVSLVSTFRAQYFSSVAVDSLKSVIVGSASGNLWKEYPYGHMTQISTSLTFNDSLQLTAAQSGQKLYIADYGDLRANASDGTISGSDLDSVTYPDWSTLGIDVNSDVVVLSDVGGATTAGTYAISSVAAGVVTLASAPGDGTATFRIERGPKVYDPSTDTVSIHTATASKGQVPTGCPLITRFLDRIVYAGADIAAHVWYMSRVGDPDDWDYSQEDTATAVAGSLSEAGVPGEAITALAPHHDDYLIMGCRNSLWRMRGDPAYGGTLDALSNTIGIIGRNAWCFGPAGELIFLSLDGLYVLPPGADSMPISVSREVLPQELQNLDPNDITVSLEYDVHDRGVHIFVTPSTSNTTTHWWFDWPTKTFWPATYTSDHEPTATCAYLALAPEDSGVILGGRDGKLRRPSGHSSTDQGTSFTSYVMLGPIALNADGYTGALISMDGILSASSGNITWSVHPADTFEAAIIAASNDSGTWTSGLNLTEYPQGSGQAFCLKLTGAGTAWAFENASIMVREGGRRRQL